MNPLKRSFESMARSGVIHSPSPVLDNGSEKEEGELSDGEVTEPHPLTTSGQSFGYDGRRGIQRRKGVRGDISKKSSRHFAVLEGYRRASSVAASPTVSQPTPATSNLLSNVPATAIEPKMRDWDALPPKKLEKATDRAVIASSSQSVDAHRHRAKQFIKILHEYQYSFRQLIAEGFDERLLKDFFEELRLPIPNHNLRLGGSEAQTSLHELQSPGDVFSNTKTIQDEVKRSKDSPTTTTSQASTIKLQAAPLDRSEYIARLMAAKNKTNSTENTRKHTVSPKHSAVTTLPVVRDESAVQGSAIEPIIQASEQRRKAQTELARLRIEALQSKKITKFSKLTPTTESISQPSDVVPPGLSLPSTENTSPSEPVLTQLGRSKIQRDASDASEEHQEQNLKIRVPLEVPHTESHTTQRWNSSNSGLLPGLAMDSTERSSEKFSSSMNSLTAENNSALGLSLGSSVRKRPVAADFFDGPDAGVSTKRPFGESRAAIEMEGIIIEASDDDSSDGEDMDHELQTTFPQIHSRFVDTPRDLNSNSTTSLSKIASRSDNANSSASALAVEFLSAQQTKDLQSREHRISLMKKRIAEMEEKRKARSSQGVETSPNTPRQLLSFSSAFPTEFEKQTLGSQDHASDEASSAPFSGSENRSTPSSLSKPEPCQPHATEGKEGSYASPLPADDTVSGIAQGRSDDESHTANGEVEVVDEDLHNTDNKIPENRTAEANMTNTTAVIAVTDSQAREPNEGDDTEIDYGTNDTASSMSISVQDENDSLDLSDSQEEGSISEHATNTSKAIGQMDGTTSQDEHKIQIYSHPTLTPVLNTSSNTINPVVPQVDVSRRGQLDELVENKSDSGSNNNLQQVSHSRLTDQSSDSESDLDNAIYSLQKTFATNGSEASGAAPDDLPHADDSTSFQMSDDDYEPPEMELSNGPVRDEGEIEMEEDYEPPEVSVVSKVQDTEHSSLLAIRNGQASGHEYINDALGKGIPIADPDIRLDQDPLSQSSESSVFIPYESPLKMFKDFRNHPQFLTQVRGGFRSPTYSHAIDPDQPLCPYEAAGGTCNDTKCPHQHFRTMPVADDTVLLQLGRRNPGSTEEEKTTWTAGLKQLLQGLRSSKIEDSEVVAAEIAAYRRTFLNDPSRILNL